MQNRVVMVTGGSSGIGEATARHMASLGARVVITSERKEDLETVASSISESGGLVVPIHVDFSKTEEVCDLFARAEALAGPIDTLVNNAGVGMRAEIGVRPEADLRFLFEINFFALTSLCSQAFVAMRARRSGRIINVSSAAGQFGFGGMSAYSASKGAVHAYTQALRVEAREHGVQVSEIIPISVSTPFFNRAKGSAYRPVGIVITPESVANSITRCATASRAKAEVLPYPWIRAVFVLNALLPGPMVRAGVRAFERSRKLQQ